MEQMTCSCTYSASNVLIERNVESSKCVNWLLEIRLGRKTEKGLLIQLKCLNIIIAIDGAVKMRRQPKNCDNKYHNNVLLTML